MADVFLQARRDGNAVKRFFRRLPNRHGDGPRNIVIDKLRSCGIARREPTSESIHDTSQYANNRAALSIDPDRGLDVV